MTTPTSTPTRSRDYPVHVDAKLDAPLSRWLWLVKWLLAIPHYVVLALLWVTFVVLSIVAFFAILFTGRYPRAIFDFNVGVLRWTWRVNYYAYSALGTDHYPPFTLDDRPDYPAHFEVDYPDHLSRGLVLVKWWLLAIPHYLLVALFTGGLAYTIQAGSTDVQVYFSLIGVLVVVAAVALLFTGRYPGAVFDLVLGLNRWVLRVSAYASLMTDEYPPFRLDQGGADPARLAASSTGPTLTSGGAPPPAVPTTPAGQTGTPPTPQGLAPGWTAGRVVAVVLGSLLLVGAIGSGLGAGAVAIARAARDSDGYLTSPTRTLTTESYALVTESAEIRTGPDAEWVPHAMLGDTRVTATSTVPVFVGIARTADVDSWLGGAEHATVSRMTSSGTTYTVSGEGPRRSRRSRRTSGWPRPQGPAPSGWCGRSSPATGRSW
ncbi:MAG: DUF4389 domain-containing protein [Nocardioides sp.]